MTDLDGTWRLVDLSGLAPADGGRGPVTLTFDGDGQVYGMAGVNRVRGTYTRDEQDRLVVGPLVSTMMAGPPEATAGEAALLRFFAEPVEVAPAQVGAHAEDGLELTAADGVVAHFAPYTPVEEV